MRVTAFPALVIVAACLLSLPCGARAQGERRARVATPAPDAATEAQKEAARSAYRRGQRAFNVARYEEAALAFEEAFAAIPNPVVLLSIAESRAKMGQPLAAIAALRKYLALRQDAPDRVTVEEKIALLSRAPARLSVTSDPPHVNLELDGLVHARTPAQLDLSPGEHELRYTNPGYVGGRKTVTAESGAQISLHVTLDVESAQPTAYSPTHAVESASGRPMTAIWISGGVGTAALLTGTVLGFFAIQEFRDFEVNPNVATADRGERYALAADVAIGVGIVGVATAAVLYLLSEDK